MILTYNKNLIQKTLGKQGSSQCGVYAVAYGFTILEGKCRVSGSPASHQSVANKYNGGYFANCYWSTMGVSSKSASSVKNRYGKILDELKKGKPTVVATKGSSSNHYVLVIGVKDGKTADTVDPSDFYIIDPADNKIGYFGSTWAHGFNNSSYGLQYITFPGKGVGATGAVGGADHPRSWYTKKYGNEAKVYFALRDEGLSHKAACAIMGNMKQESGFSPTVVNSIGATGLCQWYRGRCTNMKKFNSGHAWNTIPHQIKYLMKELKSGYKEKVYNVLINNKKSLKDMTYAFLRHFEIPGNYETEINRRYPNAKEYYSRYSKAFGAAGGMDGDEYATDTAAVNMQQRSSQLYSSASYEWVSKKEEEKYESKSDKFARENTEAIRDYLNSISIDYNSSTTFAIPDYTNIKIVKSSNNLIRSSTGILPIATAMVESPFVEVNFKDITVGTVNNSLDEFPNHISQLEVQKINGEINKYSFNLVHQIRAGEDPNLFDKIFSHVRYERISIKYGDYASNTIYGDEKAFITDVVMNRDYVSNRINYTVHATSAGSLVTSYKLNFSTRTDKPSNVINDLLYKNSTTSKLLLDAFPGMSNKTKVNSSNLLPNTDSVVELEDQINKSPIEYINYLVGCMSNASNPVDSVIRNSSYYISYENDFNGNMGGAFFKVTEVKPNSLSKYYSNNIYEITVGYPDNNFVLGFSVSNESAWSLLYKNSSIASEYIYSLDSKGNSVKQYSPNLMSSSNPFNEIQKNWWTNMTQFPINATLTLKGLMKPVMLMDYIIVNVVFYGQKHITSGVYTITGQTDTLSGDGFRTALSLTRIGAI